MASVFLHGQSGQTLQKTVENGMVWTASNKQTGNFYSVFETKSGRILAGAYGDFGIWYSDDAGTNWANTRKTMEYCYGFTQTPTERIISANSDGLYYSDDDGMNWTKINLANRWRSVYCDKTGKVWAGSGSQGEGLRYSTDDGITWKADTNITTGQWCVIAETPGGMLITGSDYGEGIMYSTDGGATWVKSTGALGSFACFCNTKTGRIIAGASYNAGLWYSDDDGVSFAKTTQKDLGWNTVCQTNDGRLFAGNSSRTGVWYSYDNGMTWAKTGSEQNSISCIIVTRSKRMIACNQNESRGIWFSDATEINEENILTPASLLAGSVGYGLKGKPVAGLSPRTTDLIATSAELDAGALSLSVPAPVETGTMVKFEAPCTCAEVTGGLVIDGTTYTVVDALGNTVTGVGGVWDNGAQVSVLIDKEDAKAYIQNPASAKPVSHKDSHKTGGADALTPEDIGAAPASHANDTKIHVTEAEHQKLKNLGEFAMTAKSVTNWNAATVSGIYIGNAAAQNAPTAETYFGLVFEESSMSILQIVYGSGDNKKLYRRYLRAFTWTAWEEVGGGGYTYSTTDLVAGSSPLEEGKMYLVYE